MLFGLLRRKRDDDRVIFIDQPDFARATRRTDAIEEFNVGGSVGAPLFGDVVLIINCLYRAYRFAGATIDAFVRLYVQHSLPLIDAINRALFNASLVL